MSPRDPTGGSDPLVGDPVTVDLSRASRRELNRVLHEAEGGSFRVLNPRGAHGVACGIDADVSVEICGSVGYYCAGMNQRGSVCVHGNAGTGLAENIMSGTVRITGSATMSAGATGHGGLVVIGGSAGARCGISMKGVDIVVGGDVGHMSAFMAQAGNLVVLGGAGADLGDSIYEASLFVRGDVESLGADAVEKDLRPEHVQALTRLLDAAAMEADPGDFRRYGSARQLYNFHVDDIDAELAMASGRPEGRASSETDVDDIDAELAMASGRPEGRSSSETDVDAELAMACSQAGGNP